MKKQEFLKELGELVKLKREQNHLSQVGLADLLESSTRQVQRIENAKSEAGIYHAFKLMH